MYAQNFRDFPSIVEEIYALQVEKMEFRNAWPRPQQILTVTEVQKMEFFSREAESLVFFYETKQRTNKRSYMKVAQFLPGFQNMKSIF
jgi:hypothetical protein